MPDRKWYTIEALLSSASKVRESYCGMPAREGVVADTPRIASDRLMVIFDGGVDGIWTDPRQLDYYIDGKWVPGQDALSVSPGGKTMMYKIADLNDPDIGWVIYPTRDEASRAFDDLLESLWPDDPMTWHISAIEMTPEEFEALPELDR